MLPSTVGKCKQLYTAKKDYIEHILKFETDPYDVSWAIMVKKIATSQ